MGVDLLKTPQLVNGVETSLSYKSGSSHFSDWDLKSQGPFTMSISFNAAVILAILFGLKRRESLQNVCRSI